MFMKKLAALKQMPYNKASLDGMCQGEVKAWMVPVVGFPNFCSAEKSIVMQ